MKNIGLVGILKVVENNGTINFIAEGDYVICCVDDNVYNIGKLTRIVCLQTNDAEIVPVAVVIESRIPKMVSSTNVVLLSDIKCLHKMTEEERREIEGLISKIVQTDATENE